MSQKTRNKSYDGDIEHKTYPEYNDFEALEKIWIDAIMKSRANNPFMHNQPYLTASNVDPKLNKSILDDDSLNWNRTQPGSSPLDSL